MKKGLFGKMGKLFGSNKSGGGTCDQSNVYPCNYPTTYSDYHPSPPLGRNISFQHSQTHSGELQSPRNMPNPRGQRFRMTYSRIGDNYNSLPEVKDALYQAGLESSNLIVGIDFTKSNTWTGTKSFKGLSLHHVGDMQNPYEQAISIIGRTLFSFDEDNLIPCYGFGDAKTHDKHVFNFYPDGRSCNGFEEALTRYRELVPHVQLSGPTSFAPIIEMALTIVEQNGGQYHVLLIIADGQVTGNGRISQGELSYQEQTTIEAIVKASEYALSIVLVGVGDGPWNMMKEFDDNIPERAFDNFQFVNFTEIMGKNLTPSKKEAEFALAALMEIPSQYKATLDLGILGRPTGRSPQSSALPPPSSNQATASMRQRASQPIASFRNSTSGYGYTSEQAAPSTTRPSSSSRNNQNCPVCLSNCRNMAFGCGHRTCQECGPFLEICPICQAHIDTRIRLY